MVINVQKLCPTLVAGLDVLAVGWSGRPLGLYDTVFPFGFLGDPSFRVLHLSLWWGRSAGIGCAVLPCCVTCSVCGWLLVRVSTLLTLRALYLLYTAALRNLTGF